MLVVRTNINIGKIDQAQLARFVQSARELATKVKNDLVPVKEAVWNDVLVLINGRSLGQSQVLTTRIQALARQEVTGSGSYERSLLKIQSQLGPRIMSALEPLLNSAKSGASSKMRPQEGFTDGMVIT